MSSVDQILEREVRKGMTREDLVKRAGALGLVVSAGAFGPLTESAFGSVNAKRGGTFRIGVSGGSTKDFIDGQHIVAKTDIARLVVGWDGLSYFDENYKPQLSLAEELKAENPKQWLIRVRDGVEFHNGRTLTADDVIYSIRRTLKKKLGLFGLAAYGAIDPKRLKKLDKRTVRVFLSRPDVTLIDSFSQYFSGIVPVGYQPDAVGKGALQYIGTGPFKVKSFTPGRQSVHVRNENYWRTGQPYFDQVVIIDFPDDSARVNALLSGQVDAITDVPFAQIKVVTGRNNLKLYQAPTGAWTPLSMRVDTPPFDDNRVRQAMRLLINRPQVIKQGLSGFGRVGNDIYSPFDQCYAGDDFPQRAYDPEKAKSLLKAAGQEGLTVDLVTSPADTGMVEGAQIFAENAKAGGVTVNVQNVDGGVIYGDQYLKWPFAADYWGTRNYLAQVAVGSLAESPFNETHWHAHPQFGKFLKLYRQASATVDVKKRCQIVKDMQRLEYDEGGHIIWGFKNLTDGYNRKVGGLKTDRGTLNLNKYGNGFRTIYFA